MRIIKLVLLFILIKSGSVYGQKYGNVWQFGDAVGLDFNSCTPVVITGVNNGFEGCSSICDSTGQLLFYTNSDKVWDRANNLMPNGNLIASSGTLSQVIIIPKPLSNSAFYIITTKIQAQGSLSLRYHEVDMTLNSGFGDVISSNNELSTLNVTEQISATFHDNGTDIWLMTHEYATNNFLAFLVTSSGISTTPVISSVGPAHSPCTSNINARGEIKFSPNGNYLAFNANGIGGADSTNILALCNFDASTGIVSNPINLPFSRGEFGLSFSPDGSKLFGTTWKAFMFTLSDYNYLYQFDLSSGSPSTIINSKQIIDSAMAPASYGTLKIGPDGKIYVRHIESTGYIGVINNPNNPGLACGYNKNGLYVGNPNYQYGLNNYIEYVKYCTGLKSIEETYYQNALNIFPNPFSNQTNIQSSILLENAHLTIFNLTGQPVKEVYNISGDNITLLRENLCNGIYFIRLTQNNRIIATSKIIVNE